MLEKIGLPAKPSLRGNTWVVDASHCQGCTSQFTFINRKQKMFLRGQGDSLCAFVSWERHGHKTRAGRGAILIPSKVVSSFVVALNICRLKLTSKPEDEVLNQILGNDRKESGQESNSNVVAGMQRASSSASVQIVNKISATMGCEKYIEVFLLMSLIIYRVVMDLLLLRIWMNDDKQQEFSIQYEQEDGFNFDHLISAADDHILDINFEVTDEDMEDPEKNAALQSLGWSQDSKNPENPA
ncbi:unnamed protein product [Prunus brigantina]